MVERYDTVVIGGGMAGLPLALRASRHGRTALIESELLGGTCLNRGCIPTKTMIATAELAHRARRATEFGITLGSDVSVDVSAVVDRKDGIVDAVRSGSYRSVDRADDLDLIEGHGVVVGPRRLRVGDAELEADRIFLNTGTRDAQPAIDGLDRVPFLTSRSMLELRELPGHLVVVGGGFIGCEFAQMFRRFGAQVTVIQRADRLIPAEDPDISAAVKEGFEADGIRVLAGVACTNVDGDAGSIRVGCDTSVDDIIGTHLLIATGRTPNTDRLGLEHLDLEPDRQGFLSVDDRLRTGTEDVWALGDLRGTDMFTHTARDDADVAYRAVFKNDADASIAERIVPHAVFVDPEVGSVGLTEAEARDAGHDIAVGVQRFDGVAKARAMGNTRGFIKIVADAATDKILGCHIAGPEAGNLVHEAVIAMVAGATYTDLRTAIHIHPTLAEGVNSAAGGVHRSAS